MERGGDAAHEGGEITAIASATALWERIEELTHIQQEHSETRTQLAIALLREEDLRRQLSDHQKRLKPNQKDKGSKEH